MRRKVLLVLLSVVLMVGLCLFPINANSECDSWSSFMAGGDRSSSSSCVIDPIDPNFGLIWKQKVGHNIRDSQPVVYDNKVFICTRPYAFDEDAEDVTDVSQTNVNTSGIVCLDANTGEVLWENNLSGWGSTATPTIDSKRNSVIVGSSLKPESNRFETDESGIYCVDCNNGITNWYHKSPRNCYANGIISDNKYYIGTNSDKGFICLNAKDGHLQWSKYPDGYFYRNSPCIIDDRLFCFTYYGDINAINKSGFIKWENKDLSEGLVYEITPSVWDKKLLVPSRNGSIHCLDVDGNPQWTIILMDNNGKVDEISPCAVHNNLIYTTVTDLFIDKKSNLRYLESIKLFCVEPMAENPVIWEREIQSMMFDAPVLAGNHLFYTRMIRSLGSIIMGGPYVYVLNAENGSDVTRLDTEGEISTSPSIGNQKVYVGLASGEVACFGVYPIAPANVDFGDCYLQADITLTLRIKNIFEEEDPLPLKVNENSSWFEITESTKDMLFRREYSDITISTIPEQISKLPHHYNDYVNISIGTHKYKVPVSLNTIYPDKVYLSPTDANCQIGDTIQFTARPMGADAERLSGYTFEWDVSNRQVGMVDQNGLFTSIETGNTLVRAYIKPKPRETDLIGSAEVTVVNALPPKVADVVNFGKVNLFEENITNLTIENCSNSSKTFYFTAYETWYRLSENSVTIPENSSKTVTITLDNKRFKPGEKKVGDLKVAWSNNSKTVTIIAQAQIDSTPPVIILDEIDEVIDKLNIIIHGEVNEKCELFVNDEFYGSFNKTFELELLLDTAPSSNYFKIIAKDKNGNTAIKDITIINNHMLTIKSTIENKIMYVDGTLLELDVPPIIISGRTMVPFRAIAEAFEANVSWDAGTKTVSIILGDIVIQLTIGNTTAIISGSSIKVDPPAQIVNGRTMVPLRFVSESFEADVAWNGDTKTITVTKLIIPS